MSHNSQPAMATPPPAGSVPVIPVIPHTPTPSQKSICIEYPTNSSNPPLPPLTFSSAFDSGNLSNVKQQPNTSTGPGEYHLYTARDACDTVHEAPYSTWFHFSVFNTRVGQTLHMCIANMNKQSRLYKQDYRPFYKIVELLPDGSDGNDPNNWQRLPTPCSSSEDKESSCMQLRFKFKFDCHFLQQVKPGLEVKPGVTVDTAGAAPGTSPSDYICGYKVYFAFCFPQSYTQSQTTLQAIDSAAPALRTSNNIYYHREQLTSSLDGRRIELLTITDDHNLPPAESGE